jgi:hypothetical protein
MIAGSFPAEAVGFFRRKNPQHAFLRKGSKAVCPMAQICGMLKIPKWSKKGVISAKSPNHSRPQFHLLLLGALALMGMWRHLAVKMGTSKGRGKQWQTTPKNLPRMRVPEPYWSPECALVPAKTGPKSEY